MAGNGLDLQKLFAMQAQLKKENPPLEGVKQEMIEVAYLKKDGSKDVRPLRLNIPPKAKALMPLIGWALGTQFMWLIEPVDHWVAFVLLAFIGGKMLWEAFHEEDDCGCEDTSGIDLREFLVLAVATSIDALAAGISFAALNVDIVASVALIGVITFGLSFIGVAVGHFFGARYEKPASIVGGVVLILIGLKVLLEHLGLLAL